MIGKRHCDAILSYRALIVASDPKSELPRPPPHLTTLPAELQLAIFKELHPVDSACLGVTCKALYTIHRELHGSVKLDTVYIEQYDYFRLAVLLRQWGGRSEYWCFPAKIEEQIGQRWTMRFLKCGLAGTTGTVCSCKFDQGGGGWIPKCRVVLDA